MTVGESGRPQREASAAMCNVDDCGWVQIWPTRWQAQAADVWHVYEDHPLVWSATIGDRPPLDPKPDELAVENLTRFMIDDTLAFALPAELDHPELGADTRYAKVVTDMLRKVAVGQIDEMSDSVDQGLVVARELISDEWLVSRSADDVTDYMAGHDCDVCRSGRERVLGQLRDDPARSVAIGHVHFVEYVYPLAVRNA